MGGAMMSMISMTRWFLCLVVLAVAFRAAGVSAGETSGFHVADTLDWSGVIAHKGISSRGFQDEARTGSSWYFTESGYVAAVEEGLLDRAIFWAGLGDAAEFERFLESTPLVFPLRAGLRVQIEKFSFSGKVLIRPQGADFSVWTVMEAIRSEVSVSGS
jgi:hypothetical protein